MCFSFTVIYWSQFLIRSLINWQCFLLSLFFTFLTGSVRIQDAMCGNILVVLYFQRNLWKAISQFLTCSIVNSVDSIVLTRMYLMFLTGHGWHVTSYLSRGLSTHVCYCFWQYMYLYMCMIEFFILSYKFL